MRHALRCGHAAHVDEKLDVVVLQQRDEVVERTGRVPDRED
jgi:hypothetical protein